MTKFYCDNCGKELEKRVVINMRFRAGKSVLFGEYYPPPDGMMLDLCVDCAKRIVGEGRIAEVIAEGKRRKAEREAKQNERRPEEGD